MENVFLVELGQILSEMDVWTFERIKRVIWDQLLATQAEIGPLQLSHHVTYFS